MEEQIRSAGLKDFLNKPTTIEFLRSARQFVALLELENINNEEFYKKVHFALVDLYFTGQRFEEVDIEFSRTDIDPLFEDKNANKIADLGGEAFYWEVFDPAYDKDKEATQGWLVDDFGDIYRDLKTALCKIVNIGSNDATGDALWSLNFSFHHHWGQHCISALRALHYLHYDGKKT